MSDGTTGRGGGGAAAGAAAKHRADADDCAVAGCEPGCDRAERMGTLPNGARAGAGPAPERSRILAGGPFDAENVACTDAADASNACHELGAWPRREGALYLPFRPTNASDVMMSYLRDG